MVAQSHIITPYMLRHGPRLHLPEKEQARKQAETAGKLGELRNILDCSGHCPIALAHSAHTLGSGKTQHTFQLYQN